MRGDQQTLIQMLEESAVREHSRAEILWCELLAQQEETRRLRRLLERESKRNAALFVTLLIAIGFAALGWVD